MKPNTKTGSRCRKTVKEQMKAKWEKLTDNDINEAEKNMKALTGTIRKAYGHTREVADREVTDFQKSLAGAPAQSKQI